ncbi:MAG TPA: helix-turn-helix domain-containing protein [Candidatus Paceibacterota bacterium]
MSQIIDNSAKDEIFSSLKELGLSSKEAKVYTSLLSLGESGSTAIAKDSGLHRQFVYDTLVSLEKKGLTGHTIVKGRKRFFPYPPSKLGGFFEHKKRIADSVVRQLEKSFLIPDIQELESYRGQEAFVANEFEILRAARPGSKMYVLGGSGDEYVKNHGKYFDEYEYQRQKKGIELLYIGSSSQKEFLRENNGRPLFKYRLMPIAFTGNLNITIYDNRICFYMYGSQIAVFSVKSERIAKSYTDFFMGLWNISK